MKIKAFTVLIEWEDGTVDNVSDYLPAGTWQELENFCDYWEEEQNDSFFQEISDYDVICPHCGYECDIGGLIGEHTNDCPKCGKTILESKTA